MTDIEEIKVMRLLPGDTLVLRVDRALSQEVADRITKTVEPLIPDGVKVLVLERGMSLEVVRASRPATEENDMFGTHRIIGLERHEMELGDLVELEEDDGTDRKLWVRQDGLAQWVFDHDLEVVRAGT